MESVYEKILSDFEDLVSPVKKRREESVQEAEDRLEDILREANRFSLHPDSN